MKFIFCIFIFFLLIFLTYMLVIVILKHLFRKNTTESKAMLADFLRKIFSFFETPKPADCFPVLIGSNGLTLRDDIINASFHALYRFYDDWFFEIGYFLNNNVVVYQFRIYNPTENNIKPQITHRRIRQIAEKALSEHLHTQGLYFPVDNFVAVSIQADILKIFIACNEAGFIEIANLRRTNPCNTHL